MNLSKEEIRTIWLVLNARFRSNQQQLMKPTDSNDGLIKILSDENAELLPIINKLEEAAKND